MRRILPLFLLLGSAPLFASTYVVNNLGDAPDAAPGDNACATAGAVCTFRAALREANAYAGADTIYFAIAGTITPATAYPAAAGEVTIDGASAPGYSTAPVVDIHGAGAVPIGLWFLSSAPSSRLVGLKVHGFTNAVVSVAARGFTVTRCYLGPVGGGIANGVGLILEPTSSQTTMRNHSGNSAPPGQVWPPSRSV